MTQVLLLFGVAVLVALNALFVAAEFSLVRASQGRVEQLRDEGNKAAALVARQIDRIDEYLSACQLGITMTSLGIGFLGEPAIAQIFEDLFGTSISHGASLAISLTLAYLITTALHITFGEQVPKIYSIVHSEKTAMRVARPLEWFRRIFNPLIWLLNSASNWILRLLGVDSRAEFEEVSSSEDLKLIIARSQRGGKLDPGEAGMLSGVFHLHEQQARQVMTPIPAVVTVDLAEAAEAALRRAVDSGHTRMVVTEDGNDDRIKGIVHVNSLARKVMMEGPQASIQDIVKDALIVPETKPLDDLLADLQRERASMAVVVDEYGRTITDLADYGLDLPVDSDSYNSVGGFVFGELGRLPKRGDMVQVNGYSLRVESVRENRVEAVRIRDHHARGEDGPSKGNTVVRPIEQAASTPRGVERRASEQ
jgi:CBS domain containing-hemolysin-like protein